MRLQGTTKKPHCPPGLREALGWRSVSRFLWKLGTMPHSNNPDDIGFNFVKEPIGRDDNL